MMRRYVFALLLSVWVVSGFWGGGAASANVPAQLPPPFPLPAPLYFLTSEYQLVRMEPDTGGVVPISDPNQPIADFDIAPDGEWVVYRTLYEGRVIVTSLSDGRGQVLSLEGETPPTSSPRQTIAWSPKGDAVAYIVAGEGVRVRSLVAPESAETTVRGAWVELYWQDDTTLLASDETGAVTRITRRGAQVTLTAAPDVPARPQPAFPAYLSAQGVVYDNVPIPNTAGALAFDWGPPPLPSVQGLLLPADLFFLADGVLWRLPRDGGAAYALVRDPQRHVWAYALNADGTQIAYIADAPDGSASLHILDIASGADRALPATLRDPVHDAIVGPAWQPNGEKVAYADGAGLWLAPTDGSAPPTLLFANQGTGENPSPSTVRRYHTPCWSPDGSRLLVTVGLWESIQWLVYDMHSGTPRTLKLPAAAVRWADETHLLAWAWSWSIYFDEPALYLVALNAPESAQLTPLLDGQAVYDVRYTPQTGLYVLTGPPVFTGPAYAQVLHAPSLSAPEEALPLGGFVDANRGAWAVRLSPPADDGLPVLAVLRRAAQPPQDDELAGTLTVLTAERTVQIAGGFVSGRVHTLRWGR